MKLNEIGSQKSTATSKIWMSRMSGKPSIKYQCLVLWRKISIPSIEPRLPPMIAIENRVASGIRKAFLRAFRLSIPIKANPIILVKIKYPIIRTKELMNYLFDSTSCIFIARTLLERPKRLIKPSASW